MRPVGGDAAGARRRTGGRASPAGVRDHPGTDPSRATSRLTARTGIWRPDARSWNLSRLDGGGAGDPGSSDAVPPDRVDVRTFDGPVVAWGANDVAQSASVLAASTRLQPAAATRRSSCSTLTGRRSILRLALALPSVHQRRVDGREHCRKYTQVISSAETRSTGRRSHALSVRATTSVVWHEQEQEHKMRHGERM